MNARNKPVVQQGDVVGGRWQVGEQLAYQGKEGCTYGGCTRRTIGDGESQCIGWHCPRCDAPCSSMGHTCKEAA